MKCLIKLKDDQYPYTGITHTRNIARAIVINDKKEVLLLHLLGDDDFGHRDYYETPGGGVLDGESEKEAVLREVEEETGFQAEILSEIGYVDDYYNLIRRHNISNYFLVKVISQGKTKMEEYEKTIIESTGWHSIKEAISMYENMNKEKLEILVRRRELPVLKEAIKILSCEEDAYENKR